MATCTSFIRRSERLDEDAIGEILVRSPSEVHWSVPGVFALPDEDCHYMKSSSFVFMDGEWCLRCWPDGCYGDENLWLGLESVYSPSNTSIKYRGGIKAEDGSEVSRIQEHEFGNDGYTPAIPLPVVMKTRYFREQLAPQGKITFFCSFLSSCSESETSQNAPLKGEILKQYRVGPRCADKLNECFEKLFLTGDHHDVIIKVQDQEIRAHKLIMAVRCPVFASMFRHDMIEKNTGVVTIEDCDPEAFREFLSFLYSAKLKNVSDDNVIELYVIADKYQVDEVKSECLKFMTRNMSDETFCDFISLALRYSETDLLNSATDYFVKNVKTIIVTVKWQTFHKEYPVESNELYIKGIAHLSPD